MRQFNVKPCLRLIIADEVTRKSSVTRLYRSSCCASFSPSHHTPPHCFLIVSRRSRLLCLALACARRFEKACNMCPASSVRREYIKLRCRVHCSLAQKHHHNSSSTDHSQTPGTSPKQYSCTHQQTVALPCTPRQS